MKFKNFLFNLLFVLFSLHLSFAIATENNEVLIETKRSGYWTYYCTNLEKQRQCEIVRKINIEEHDETFLIAYKITKNINSKIKENLNIFTPPSSKVDVGKRLKISFDGKTKITRSFLKCEDDKCLIKFKGNKILKYSMKNFKKMKITFYAPNEEDSTSLTLPMDGFVLALNNINKELKSF